MGVKNLKSEWLRYRKDKMNIQTPDKLKKALEKEYEEIDSMELDRITSSKDYKYGDTLKIQLADPLDTCTHYNYVYFKKRTVEVQER